MKLLLEFYAAEIHWVNCLHFLHVKNHLMHAILYSFSIKSPSKGVQLYPSPVKPRMQAQVRSSLSMLSLSQVALEWQGADWHGSGTEIQLSNSMNCYFVWKKSACNIFGKLTNTSKKTVLHGKRRPTSTGECVGKWSLSLTISIGATGCIETRIWNLNYKSEWYYGIL